MSSIQPIPTVNVIETCGGAIYGLTSFHDNAEGNGAAEDLFKKLMRENERCSDADNALTEEDIDNALSEGLYDNGDYSLSIVNSTQG